MNIVGDAAGPGNVNSAICDDVGATLKYVIYGGSDEFPVSTDVTVISLPRFIKKLESGLILRSRE